MACLSQLVYVHTFLLQPIPALVRTTALFDPSFLYVFFFPLPLFFLFHTPSPVHCPLRVHLRFYKFIHSFRCLTIHPSVRHSVRVSIGLSCSLVFTIPFPFFVYISSARCTQSQFFLTVRSFLKSTSM